MTRKLITNQKREKHTKTKSLKVGNRRQKIFPNQERANRRIDRLPSPRRGPRPWSPAPSRRARCRPNPSPSPPCRRRRPPTSRSRTVHPLAQGRASRIRSRREVMRWELEESSQVKWRRCDCCSLSGKPERWPVEWWGLNAEWSFASGRRNEESRRGGSSRPSSVCSAAGLGSPRGSSLFFVEIG